MLERTCRARRVAAPFVIAVQLAVGALIVVPFAPVPTPDPVPVAMKEIQVAVDGERTVELPFAVSHVALHWPGAPDAIVTVAFSPDGRTFGPATTAEADELGDRSGTNETYSNVIVAGAARYIRLTADRSIPGLAVVAMDSHEDETVNAGTPSVAEAAVSQPAIISRAAWGADESLRFDAQGQEVWPEEFEPVQKIVIHHTVTSNNDPNPAATVRAVLRLDAITKGWGDIGYNFLIDAQGRIYEGRYSRPYAPGEIPTGEDLSGNLVVGAHVLNFNAGVIGIAMLGTHSSVDVTPAARAALERLLAWETERHGIDPLGSARYVNAITGVTKTFPNIAGHRDLAATACPGAAFYVTLPIIRRTVVSMVAATTGPSVDQVPPSVLSLVPGGGSPTISHALAFGVVFSEPVTDIAPPDISITGTSTGWSVASVTGSAAIYRILLTADAPTPGTVGVSVGAGSVTDLGGNSGPVSSVASPVVSFLPSTYIALQPTRLLDTRIGDGLDGPFVSGRPRTFPVAGLGGVPANAVAVTGNLTVTRATSAGHVTLGPVPTASPSTSTVNFPRGDTRANAVTVSLGTDGTLSAVFKGSSGATTALVFDVTGYFLPDTSGASYAALTPVRLLDTRAGNGLSGVLASGVPVTFPVAGLGGVPAGVVAVTGNLTVTGASSAGHVALGPEPTATPTTSTLNFPRGDTRANAVTVPLAPDGSLSAVFRGAPGATTALVFDVTGYFLPDTSGASYAALTPVRLLDTRAGIGRSGAFVSGKPRSLQVAGRRGVPADATAVTGNLTVIGATSAGYVSLGPIATATPSTSTLNFPKGDIRANAVTVPLAPDGTLSAVFKGSSGATTALVFDVTGYFVPATSGG